MEKIKVYSKPACGYCDAAKKLLESRGLAYIELNVQEEANLDDLKMRVPNARSVPIILIGDTIIGGYAALMEHLNQTRVDIAALENYLNKSAVMVEFTKADGSVRKLWGTRDQSIIPEGSVSGSGRTSSPDTIAVWDLENEGWRSFRKDSVIDFNVKLYK